MHFDLLAGGDDARIQFRDEGRQLLKLGLVLQTPVVVGHGLAAHQLLQVFHCLVAVDGDLRRCTSLYLFRLKCRRPRQDDDQKYRQYDQNKP